MGVSGVTGPGRCGRVLYVTEVNLVNCGPSGSQGSALGCRSPLPAPASSF